MSLIGVIVYLVVIGVLLYVVNTVIPMPQWVKTVINVIAALAVCLWLLDAFGLYHTGLRIR